MRKLTLTQLKDGLESGTLAGALYCNGQAVVGWDWPTYDRLFLELEDGSYFEADYDDDLDLELEA